MAQAKSYKARAVVLRKTKLGEKDLIVTMLADSGEIVRAVGKGARKPGAAASKLELFSCIDVMLARGRSLDVVTDVKFAPDVERCAYGLESSACAAAVAELLCAVAQEGLEHPRLFSMSLGAFSALSHAEGAHLVALTAASLLKIISTAGFKPNLESCVSCGRALDVDTLQGAVVFSVADGGMACTTCPRLPEAVVVDAELVRWARALLYATFDDIAHFAIDERTAADVLGFARRWTEFYAGRTIKSLDFVFTSGLF